MRTSRSFYVVIGAMGIAVVVLSVLLVSVSRQAAENQKAVRQLVHAVEAQRRDAQRLQRLVSALQDQVRECKRHPHRCGPPLTSAPSEQRQPGTSPQPTGSASASPTSHAPSSRPRPTPTRSPRPTPRPTPTPTPSPSPSHFCLVSRICVEVRP